MSTAATNDDTVDTVLMIADAFRAAMSETPTHLKPLAQALAEASECTFDAAFHAKYEEHALVRWNYRGCRDRLEKALAILDELERRPDPDFDADLV